MKRLKLIILIITLILTIVSCQSNFNKSKIISQGPNFFLNSILEIKIYDNNANVDYINALIKTRVEDLENKLTIKDINSEISNINANAGIKPISVSDDTYKLIELALHYCALSKGEYDITIGPVVDLWGIGTDKANVPEADLIDTALSYVDYNNLIIDDINQTVYLKRPSMKIDLGAIAKGYVTDEINEILDDNNINSAIINLGGNIYVRGSKNTDKFKVGIQDPYDSYSEYLGIYSGKNSSIVTSGIYERYYDEDGRRYHHILSTKNGYPIDNEIASVSIISSNSARADALSTSVFALGLENGFKLLHQVESDTNTKLSAIVVTKSKKIYISKNIAQDFILKNTDYKLILKD